MGRVADYQCIECKAVLKNQPLPPISEETKWTLYGACECGGDMKRLVTAPAISMDGATGHVVR